MSNNRTSHKQTKRKKNDIQKKTAKLSLEFNLILNGSCFVYKSLMTDSVYNSGCSHHLFVGCL